MGLSGSYTNAHTNIQYKRTPYYITNLFYVLQLHFTICFDCKLKIVFAFLALGKVGKVILLLLEYFNKIITKRIVSQLVIIVELSLIHI